MSYLRAKTLLPLCPSYLHKHFKTNNQTNEKYNPPGGNLKKKKKKDGKQIFFTENKTPTSHQCLWRSSFKSICKVSDNEGVTVDLQEDSHSIPC